MSKKINVLRAAAINWNNSKQTFILFFIYWLFLQKISSYLSGLTFLWRWIVFKMLPQKIRRYCGKGHFTFFHLAINVRFTFEMTFTKTAVVECQKNAKMCFNILKQFLRPDISQFIIAENMWFENVQQFREEHLRFHWSCESQNPSFFYIGCEFEDVDQLCASLNGPAVWLNVTSLNTILLQLRLPFRSIRFHLIWFEMLQLNSTQLRCWCICWKRALLFETQKSIDIWPLIRKEIINQVFK